MSEMTGEAAAAATSAAAGAGADTAAAAARGRQPARLAVHRVSTPIGGLSVVTSARGVCCVAFEDRWQRADRWLRRRFGDVAYETRTERSAAAAALAAYFEGDVAAVDALAIDTGGTEFQRAVWAALRGVPAGSTTSYAGIARAIGRPAAVRAVGAANGQNPVAIAVPCHRIVGARGALTGYGGGLHRKQWLLEHEGALLALG